jgi:hypothetical protein
MVQERPVRVDVGWRRSWPPMWRAIRGSCSMTKKFRTSQAKRDVTLGVVALITCMTAAALIGAWPPVWVLVLLGSMALALLYIVARLRSRYDPLARALVVASRRLTCREQLTAPLPQAAAIMTGLCDKPAIIPGCGARLPFGPSGRMFRCRYNGEQHE